jgi:hypothetical protein
MTQSRLYLALSAFVLAVSTAPAVLAQTQAGQESGWTEREKMLLDRVEQLQQRVAALESKSAANGASPTPIPVPPALATPASSSSPTTPTNPSSPETSPLAFSDGTTLNFDFDGYYGYNFNHPLGRVNLLRANDVTSNNFTLNQVGVVVERAPDLSVHRRLGYRLDLMFGQNTETLQGGAQNEGRPQVYRNIFQAYGSYILPLGSGLQVDFGKFASSLGYETNYTKDQFNYSRSYYFNFLPFYHEGLRATYNLNSKVSLQYWLVNGANQTEDFNGFKSQAAIITIKPTKDISWNVNYYAGQEQRDVVPALNPGIPAWPTQPGLSVIPVTTPHDGRLHIIDSYASFNLGSKWTTALEGDYVINRVASNAAPARVYGGVGYLHRQLTNSLALNGRFAYLKDRGGLFSGITQDLKDVTLTAVYQLINGFQTRLEYRRDFTNQLFFLTNNPAVLNKSQDTATLGLIWWFGGKQGAW